MSRYHKSILVVVTAVLLVTGCRERDKHGRILDTPTSGTVKIAIDESLRPLLEAEIATFEALYHRADIQETYLAEAEAIDALMNDSVRLAVVTRRFTEEEKE